MRTLRHVVLLLVAVGLHQTTVRAQAPTPPMLVLGDSLGEGVQSGDASTATQPFSYASLLASKIGVALPLPLIQSGPLGVVGSTSGRTRLDSSVAAANLSTSGADVGSLLRNRADGVIDSEIDLVLSPRIGSQVEVAEAVGAPFVVCWIGSNDALGAVTSFNHLDASQLTPVAQFQSDLQEIMQRLTDAGSVVTLANIPDVSDIGYLLDHADLIRLLGSDFGMPAGNLTTVPAMMLVKLGLDDGSVFQNPDFLLDPTELAIIRDRIVAFNDVTAATAATFGSAVVDIHGIFKTLAATEPVVFGVPLTARYLGGLFSLDGVHPSNTGHAVVASAFIGTLNAYYGVNIPQPTLAEWTDIFYGDPFIDKDGDGRVTGRPGAGLIETIGPLLGISGDSNDLAPSALDASGQQQRLDTALALIEQAAPPSARAPAEGHGPSRDQAIAALRRAFGAAGRPAP